MQRKGETKKLLDILDGIFDDMRINQTMENYKVWDYWEDTVGKTIAKKAHPERIRYGVLFVNVVSSVWMQELSFLKDVIIEKLNRKLDAAKIRDIRFKIGQIPESSRFEIQSFPTHLEKEEEERILNQTSSIQDKDVRESLQSLFTVYLKRKKHNRF